MRTIQVRELSQLPFKVMHMVVWRDTLVVLADGGMLYAVELIDGA